MDNMKKNYGVATDHDRILHKVRNQIQNLKIALQICENEVMEAVFLLERLEANKDFFIMAPKIKVTPRQFLTDQQGQMRHTILVVSNFLNLQIKTEVLLILKKVLKILIFKTNLL